MKKGNNANQKKSGHFPKLQQKEINGHKANTTLTQGKVGKIVMFYSQLDETIQ